MVSVPMQRLHVNSKNKMAAQNRRSIELFEYIRVEKHSNFSCKGFTMGIRYPFVMNIVIQTFLKSLPKQKPHQKIPNFRG